jgi:hypothetical protein
LLLSLQNKYGRINDRMRSLAHERMKLAAHRNGNQAVARIAGIDRQMAELRLRLRKQQRAVLLLFWAVIAFVADSLVIAASLLMAPLLGDVLLHVTILLVHTIFLLGMGLVLLAIVHAAAEIRMSTSAVEHEVEEALKL